MEKKANPSYRKEIENKIVKKQEELNALVEPKAVSDPNDDPEKKKKSEKINKQINKIKKDIKALENKISDAETQKRKALDDQTDFR